MDDFFFTPQYVKSKLLAPYGSGFSITPALMQSATLRFPNHSPKLSDLYFAGAGRHSGSGMSGVATSAKVVAQLMLGLVATLRAAA